MKALVQRIYGSPTFTKSLAWGKLISVTASTQVIVQIITFVSGIIVIRVLPTQEYAVYTLANTMLANMIVLADGGIKTSVLAESGKVWGSKEQLGIVLVTGLQLRKQFAVRALFIAVPVLLFLLVHQKVSLPAAFLIVLSIVPAFYAFLHGSLLEIAPKLWQRIAPLQRIQLSTAFARITILGAVLVKLPWAFVAVLAAAIPQVWANRQLLQISGEFADLEQKSDPGVRKSLLSKVRRLLPDSIYSCISGQITIWLITIFGSMASIAQVGALGRLAMLLYIFNVMFGVLITPRYARLPDDYGLLLKRYLQIGLGLSLLCFCIVGCSYLFASEMLWILGPEYADLKSELILMMIGSCIGLLAQSIFFLCTSKGWVINPAISIPFNIVSIAAGAAMFDVSGLKGVFYLNIFINSIMALMHCIYGFVKIKDLRAVVP